MARPLELIHDTHSLFSRSLFLAIGVPFLGLGLFASAKVVLALIDILLGRPFEDGSFLLGVAVSAAFTIIGGAFVIAFFVPKRVMVFDGEAGTLTYTRVFPFDTRRIATFALSTIPLPEVAWVDDYDRWYEGYWVLKVSLPKGRSVSFPAVAETPTQQKAEVEALRDRIRDLIEKI